VLVPLIWAPDPRCILTVRAPQLSLHAGEVSFPGGRPDESDADLYATALREAAEELGIEGSTPLGELSSVPLYTSDYRLFPFVDELSSPEFRPNASEVSAVLEIPFAALFSQDSFHAIRSHYDGAELLCPIFEWEGAAIFGGTAFVLYELINIIASMTQQPSPPLVTGKYSWTDLLSPES
jgi:8-oxo-dGTP pyrophosphatase MutT (NUDIX family)